MRGTENGKTTEVLANTSRYDKRDKVVYVGPAPKTAETENKTTTETKTDSADPEQAG